MPISTVPAFRALDAYRNEFQASQCCCGGLDSSLRSSLRTPQEYFIFLERITAKKNGRPRFSTFAPLTALLHRKLPFSDTFPVLPHNTNKARLRGHLFNSCFTRRMGLAPDFKLACRFTTPNIEFVASKCTPC